MICPSSETLEQFATGSLPNAAGIEVHVAKCADCRAALDRLSDNPDLRRWAQRALSLPGDTAEDSLLLRIMNDLESASGKT